MRYSNKWRLINPTENTKVCTKCNTEKELSMFNKSKQQLDWHRCECRDCQNKINREYKKRNKEKISEYWKIYYIKNYEKHKAKRILLADKKNEYMRMYMSTERWRKLREARDAKRRALQKNAFCDWSVTQENLDIILDKQKWLCPYCNRDISDRKNRHLDHIIPLSKCWSHTIDNVQWTCVSCNLLKSNKSEDEFLEIFNRIWAPMLLPSSPNLA